MDWLWSAGSLYLGAYNVLGNALGFIPFFVAALGMFWHGVRRTPPWALMLGMVALFMLGYVLPITQSWYVVADDITLSVKDYDERRCEAKIWTDGFDRACSLARTKKNSSRLYLAHAHWWSEWSRCVTSLVASWTLWIGLGTLVLGLGAHMASTRLAQGMHAGLWQKLHGQT